MIGIERFILRDDQWERVKHLLSGKETDRGVTAKDNRLFLEAVLWIARTGAPWRDLPRYFGNWNSVYVRFSLVGEFHSCAPKSKLRPQGCLKRALEKSSGIVQI